MDEMLFEDGRPRRRRPSSPTDNATLDAFSAPPEEKEKKGAALDGLEWRRKYVLAWVRDRLKALYRSTGKPVTADDAVDMLEGWDEWPKLKLDLSEYGLVFLGALFRSEGWEMAGWVESRREGNNARTIRSWRWRP